MSGSGKGDMLKECEEKCMKFPCLQLLNLSKCHSQNMGDKMAIPEMKNSISGQGSWKTLAAIEMEKSQKERNQKGDPHLPSIHIYD